MPLPWYRRMNCVNDGLIERKKERGNVRRRVVGCIDMVCVELMSVERVCVVRVCVVRVCVVRVCVERVC